MLLVARVLTVEEGGINMEWGNANKNLCSLIGIGGIGINSWLYTHTFMYMDVLFPLDMSAERA